MYCGFFKVGANTHDMAAIRVVGSKVVGRVNHATEMIMQL
jgi:hypothetical protein